MYMYSFIILPHCCIYKLAIAYYMHINKRFVSYSFLQIILGPATKITKSQYLSIAWNDAWAATRDLATIVFGRKVLATHTLSGMSSNAKRNCTDYTAKPALPGGQVIDIIGK